MLLVEIIVDNGRSRQRQQLQQQIQQQQQQIKMKQLQLQRMQQMQQARQSQGKRINAPCGISRSGGHGGGFGGLQFQKKKMIS